MMKTRIQEEVLMYPRLEEVLMVESFIQEHNGDYKKDELIKFLPENIDQDIFEAIIEHLLEEHKISIDKFGKIGWIWDPNGANKYLNKYNLSWR